MQQMSVPHDSISSHHRLAGPMHTCPLSHTPHSSHAGAHIFS